MGMKLLPSCKGLNPLGSSSAVISSSRSSISSSSSSMSSSSSWGSFFEDSFALSLTTSRSSLTSFFTTFSTLTGSCAFSGLVTSSSSSVILSSSSSPSFLVKLKSKGLFSLLTPSLGPSSWLFLFTSKIGSSLVVREMSSFEALRSIEGVTGVLALLVCSKLFNWAWFWNLANCCKMPG